MKIIRYSIPLIAIILLAPSIYAQDDNSSDPSKFIGAMFRKKTLEWQEAFNNKDTRSLAQFYSEDARYVSSDIPGLSLTGQDKIIAYLQGIMNDGSHMDSIDILSLKISEDLATVYCDFKMTGGKLTKRGQNIMVLRKTGIKWQIFLHMVVEQQPR